MPRYPEDDDFDPRGRSPRSDAALPVGLLVLGGLVVALVCGGGAVWLFTARQQATREADEEIAARIVAEQQRMDAAGGRAGPNPNARAPAARSVVARRAFEAAVRGKTREQVVAAVGPPDADPEGDDLIYRNRVVDDVTGKVYAEARVRFGPAGRADRFEYR